MIYVFEPDATFWDSPAIATAVHDVFEACRRIEKESDPGREVVRLGVALRAIEQGLYARYSSPRVLESSAADAVAATLPLVGSVRLPFTVQSINGALKPLCFVTAVPFDKQPFVFPSTSPVSSPSNGPHVSLERKAALDVSRDQGSKLLRRIDAARRGNAQVALGNSRHVDLTKALHRYLHATDAEESFRIHFVYKDGSMGGAIHLRQLPIREEPSGAVDLCVALESCRHFDLDTEVDCYLLRNAEVARREDATFAVQEKISYERIRASLEDLCGKESLHLRLFHTGLEPAVVGFYRALIDLLLAGWQLKVTPVFFVGGRDEETWY
jgi:hypothetical protein